MICDWEIDIDAACCTAFWAGLTPDEQAAAQNFATRVLWGLTGRRFGQCPVTVRPCGRCVAQTYRTYGVWTDGYGDAAGPFWTPYIDQGGNWLNSTCGCAGLCSCEPTHKAFLGAGPIRTVTEVRVDNVVVPPANYRVDIMDGWSWLVAQNGQTWPDCQDFDQPAAATFGTFVVTHTVGLPVPEGGAAAAGMLACEYAKLCRGQECALSPAATSITRDGVTYEVLSAEDLIQQGLTPMPMVNLWITSTNPRKKAEPSRVWSPDINFPRHTVVP